MGKRPKQSPARIPTVDDFKLTKHQREFHDQYCFGETKGNAHNSALKSDYAESVAQKDSYKWIPPTGSTRESIGSARSPVAQAIFWTLYREQILRDETNARVMEKEITTEVKRRIITREYIESNLLEIVDRCMMKNPRKFNHDLGLELAAKLRGDLASLGPKPSTDAIDDVVADSFHEYCRRYHVFKPTQAKEALKLLGIEAGMFSRIIRNAPDTAVDALTPDQLVAEQSRLEKQYAELTTAIKKKGNGHARPKAN